MNAVPAETPVTIPVAEPTVATPVLLLLHIPPASESLKVTKAPGPRVDVPATGGPGIIQTTVKTVRTQPDTV